VVEEVEKGGDERWVWIREESKREVKA